MESVKIVVSGNVNISYLLIVCGAEEILRIKGITDNIPVDQVVPERIYVMSARYSAN